jgi:hypothetical protein
MRRESLIFQVLPERTGQFDLPILAVDKSSMITVDNGEQNALLLHI